MLQGTRQFTCADCKYFGPSRDFPGDERAGSCRRNPPPFLNVNTHDWCGEGVKNLEINPGKTILDEYEKLRELLKTKTTGSVTSIDWNMIAAKAQGLAFALRAMNIRIPEDN